MLHSAGPMSQLSFQDEPQLDSEGFHNFTGWVQSFRLWKKKVPHHPDEQLAKELDHVQLVAKEEEKKNGAAVQNSCQGETRLDASVFTSCQGEIRDDVSCASEASTLSDCCSCGRQTTEDCWSSRQTTEDTVEGDMVNRFSCASSIMVDVENDDEPEVEPLTMLRQALALKDDLLEALMAPAFQASVHAILRDQGGPDACLRLCQGREDLCGAALRETLPLHGFGSGPLGFQEALQVLERVALDDDEILDGLLAVYDCVGLSPPAHLTSTYGDYLPWSS